MGTSRDNAKRIAEDALWDAIEDRRDAHRIKKVRFGQRQHYKLKVLHDKGQLIDSLVKVTEAYRGDGNPENLQAMARTKKAGLDTWEDILIQPGTPWAPYMTPAAKRGAEIAIAEAEELMPFV